MERLKEDEDPAGHSAGQQEKKEETRNHSRLLAILLHEEVLLHLDQRNKQVQVPELESVVKCKPLQKKRVIAETNAVRQKQNKQDLGFYKYNHPPPPPPPQYKNVRKSKVRYTYCVDILF